MAFKSFSELRKQSKTNFEGLVKEVEKLSQGGFKEDERYWSPTVDKAGNGQAIIRFLPPTKGEEVPFVRLWSHGFQGPTGKWYIENSRTTLGEDDPASELNSELWNSGIESNKEIVRKQKRKLHFISNILVIKDPMNPENDGKVFLYKYGKQLFDVIKTAMDGDELDEKEGFNPFDFWTGADLKLRIRKVDGYRNFEKSEFAEQAPIAEDDESIEAIWNQQHSLQAEIAPDKFKSYEDLKKRLDMVLNIKSGGAKTAAQRALEADAVEDTPSETAEEPAVSEDTPEPKKSTKASKPAKAQKPAVDEDEDDVDLSYFSKLAK